MNKWDVETLDYTIRIGNAPTFLYFNLHLYSAYAAHYVYCTYQDLIFNIILINDALIRIIMGEGNKIIIIIFALNQP